MRFTRRNDSENGSLGKPPTIQMKTRNALVCLYIVKRFQKNVVEPQSSTIVKSLSCKANHNQYRRHWTAVQREWRTKGGGVLLKPRVYPEKKWPVSCSVICCGYNLLLPSCLSTEISFDNSAENWPHKLMFLLFTLMYMDVCIKSWDLCSAISWIFTH